MRNRWVFLTIGMLCCPSAFAGASDARIKSCLSDAYQAQQKFHHQHKRYSKQAVHLGLSVSEACKNLKITVLEATPTTFKVSAADQRSAWTVDHSEAMRKTR